MSTAPSASMLSGNAMPGRAKRLSVLKSRPHSYAPWHEPLSVRQGNVRFEQRILPKLSALLEGVFRDLSGLDREEAVQDATCQALEAWRELGPRETGGESGRADETALVLAKFASSRYLAGVRFANPRSASRL